MDPRQDRARHDKSQTSPQPCRRARVALLMLALMGGFYLLREHWNHIAGLWVYLLLLACPLMHLLHGHGKGIHRRPPVPPNRQE